MFPSFPLACELAQALLCVAVFSSSGIPMMEIVQETNEFHGVAVVVVNVWLKNVSQGMSFTFRLD